MRQANCTHGARQWPLSELPVSLVPQEQPIMIAMPLQQLLAIVLVASFAAKRCRGT